MSSSSIDGGIIETVVIKTLVEVDILVVVVIDFKGFIVGLFRFDEMLGWKSLCYFLSIGTLQY